MEQRFRCINCNRNETWAGYFCEKCIFNWEEEALMEPNGTIRTSPCPRCMKVTQAENVRCGRSQCMAVWPAPEPEP